MQNQSLPSILMPLNKSIRKKEALEELTYYILSSLLLTSDDDMGVSYRIFNLSKKITDTLLVDSKEKWKEFESLFDSYSYPSNLKPKAYKMILEWYTLLNK